LWCPTASSLYWLLHDFTILQAALQNRLAIAFVVDVFLTTGVLAAYFAKFPPGRYGWHWFVAFSLVGTLGFGLAFYWWLSKWPSGDATATQLKYGFRGQGGRQ
jgi:hypothetical protein